MMFFEKPKLYKYVFKVLKEKKTSYSHLTCRLLNSIPFICSMLLLSLEDTGRFDNFHNLYLLIFSLKNVNLL